MGIVQCRICGVTVGDAFTKAAAVDCMEKYMDKLT